MDTKLSQVIDAYHSFLLEQHDATIAAMAAKALLYQDLSEARAAGHDKYQTVLSCIASFTDSIYSKPEFVPAARNYSIMLVKELTRLHADNACLRVLDLVRKYDDQDGWEMVVTNANPNVRQAAVVSLKITREITGAIYGTITGAIIGAIYVAVRVWLKV